ncbi:hypothetical protein QEH59_15525 [Coraliomargarita sp. SDUM461004]|uniref:Uncharacterized protein n=1 Tax=Thalassobacterium sedimentorum TaxID=3041258 RepID=A0ABU1ANR6_9BACT|nr:hypothetical protein [Coraliomargarita sp. SDUM461004]MDQ8195843.1 hypothetical protein [Coraliomargarita sp. SDUM461004]
MSPRLAPKTPILLAILTLVGAFLYIAHLHQKLKNLEADKQQASIPLLSRIETESANPSIPLLTSINSEIPILTPIDTRPEGPTTPRRPLLLPITQPITTNTWAEPNDAFLAEARRRALKDPEAAMAWLQNQHSGSERLRGMLEVVALWATQDSESTLLWLESNAQGLARLETLNNGVELWAQRNPNAAAEWVDGMANDGSKATAAKALATQWAQADPSAAAAWVSTLPTGPIRQQATLALAESWIQIDAQAASVWALSEAEFNGNYDLLQQAIREFSQQSPIAAEAFVRDLAGAPHADKAITSLITGRAQEDPAATALWLSEMSSDDPIYSTEHANKLMQVWAESDSIAASEWLSQQTLGPLRDAAIYGFSETIQSFEPEAAATWANAISDPDQRVLRLTDSINQWARTQPHQALKWIKTAELEPAVRTHLANYIGAD